MVMMNSKNRKPNLSMAWIDYKKAFDMIPHSWLIECLEIYIWCRGKHHQIPQEHNAQLEDNSYKLWNQVSKGQHQKRDLPRRLIVSTTLISSNDLNDKGSRENGGPVPTQERRQQNEPPDVDG